MKRSEVFPSAFLKAQDIPSTGVVVTIKSGEMETLGQGKDAEEKFVLSFNETTKKLVVNSTNWKTIEKLHGEDSDTWVGKPITLVAREVDFQGETTVAIRVSLLAGSPASQPAA